MSLPFPDAENVFRDAFNKRDSVLLLDLIKAHPSLESIKVLVAVYMDVVHQSPTQFDTFAEILSKLRDSEEPTFAGCDAVGNLGTLTIANALFDVLAEFHSSDLAGVHDTSVSPSNEYLLASLLCAVSTKYNFCYPPAQDYSIRQGLRYKDKSFGKYVEARQVLALGAYLQLLICGSHLYGPTGTEFDSDGFLGWLEKIKRAGFVKDPNGQRLLEVTIEQAKGGFKNDVNDAWCILFPGDEGN